jgi:hypothetical protein
MPSISNQLNELQTLIQEWKDESARNLQLAEEEEARRREEKARRREEREVKYDEIKRRLAQFISDEELERANTTAGAAAVSSGL